MNSIDNIVWPCLVAFCFLNLTIVVGALIWAMKKLIVQMDYTTRLIITGKLFDNNGTDGLRALQTISKMHGITTPPVPLQEKVKLSDEAVEKPEGMTFVHHAR